MAYFYTIVCGKAASGRLFASKEILSMKSNKAARAASSYVFIAPHFIMFLIFAAFPTLYSIYISFCKWNFIGEPKFVGLENSR